ncbi:FKBP-type peptidyl-prolyl cis-trans isomerase [Micromonospora sp. CPCC 205371]|nr:FKBP-type peptidyl-prolyl cis-trans isomerase [Micromonospora sp. CPCC 205371]
MTKSERRAAAKAAAAEAAERKRRNQADAGGAAGVAAIAVIVVVFALVRGGETEGTASPSLTTTPAASPTAAAFPPLPAGADPALGEKPVVKAGTGDLTKLKVTTLIEGTGPAAAAGQQITVNYVGVTYKTGEEFDASWTRQQPFDFQLGQGGVIPGWDQGLVGVKVGSRVQLDIPSDLAYGDNPGEGRPAGALRFVVDLLAVQ